MDGNAGGLILLDALKRSSSIETGISTSEVAAAVMTGAVVIVKGAVEPDQLRKLRCELVRANIPYREPDFHDAESWRSRREDLVDGEPLNLLENTFLAVARTEDELGRAAHSTAERLAAYWRSLTGCEHAFVPRADRRALRPWAMYYPKGGGCFGWHSHKLEPTRIGIILSMSERGGDFRCGGTEVKTPFGIVDVTPHHDIGDVCLFRYDLQHRVAPVEPDRELRWDGTGRWTFLIQCDPRPIDPAAAR